MKLPLTCPACMQEDLAKARPFVLAELTDSNRYDTVCPRGHRAIVALQQQKFEMLFEIGLYAITDGYYREAVSSFTSSLERFYEFFVRAYFKQSDVDVAVVHEVWKAVASQSELQLGAYVMVYTSNLRRAPLLLPRRDVEFRNAVVHKGKIPTRAEAIDYGNVVLGLLRGAIRDARSAFPRGMELMTWEHIASAAVNNGGLPVATTSIPTLVSLLEMDEEHDKRTVESSFESIEFWKRLTLQP